MVTVGLIEPSQQLGLLLVGGPLGQGKQLAGRSGEMHGVGTPVTGMATALDKSAIFEIVNQANHGVAVNSHRVGEPLLGLPIGRGQVAKQAEVPGVHPQRSQAFSEPRGRVGTELGDQEADPVGEWGARRACYRVRHRRTC